jgi:malonyl CoA-acyl carrier protein transacylase
MIAYVFPGQAAQFVGIGKDLYETSDAAKDIFEAANDLLGYRLSDVMFNGSEADLKETKITQPAVYLHSVVKFLLANDRPKPQMVAGHSLGEFSALVAAGVFDWKAGLQLVQKRAEAMQIACLKNPGTMAAIVGLEDELVEKICDEIGPEVVAANYNCPGQLVVSGSLSGIRAAAEQLREAGAKRAIVLNVGGAFHSPLMQSAKESLQSAIEATNFNAPHCPIYQNVDGLPVTDPELIKANLIEQLTSPVRWTQTMQNMINDGASEFFEVGGNGKVIRGFIKRVNRKMPAVAI